VRFDRADDAVSVSASANFNPNEADASSSTSFHFRMMIPPFPSLHMSTSNDTEEKAQ
jgi:hypothetical protein